MLNVISAWKNLTKHRIFANSLLIVSYIQGAVRKALLIATFVERFKTITLGKSY